MKRIVDLLVILMLTSLGVGLVIYSQKGGLDKRELVRTREALQTIRMKIWDNRRLDTERGVGTVLPATVQPTWFEVLPQNYLLRGNRPWLDIAEPSQRALEHPLDKRAGPESARFWYNPVSGVVRARVPIAWPEDEALEAYNFVNESQLESFYDETESDL